jgi:hypothetical protein
MPDQGSKRCPEKSDIADPSNRFDRNHQQGASVNAKQALPFAERPLDEDSIVTLRSFFELLDQWDRKENKHED